MEVISQEAIDKNGLSLEVWTEGSGTKSFQEKGFMQSAENIDVYCTGEPHCQFDQRITFCLDIHNQSIKAMRFPPKSYNKDLESAEERREREQQDMEYAKELAEEDEDAFP